MRAWWAIGFAAGVAVWSRPAGADSFSAQVQTDDAACPDEAAFVARVQALSASAQHVGAAAARFHFEVHFGRTGEQGFTGRLRTRDPEGQLSEREVSAASCAEVFTTLAWIAVLHVDPAARPPALETVASGNEETPAASPPPAAARFEPVEPEQPPPAPPSDSVEVADATATRSPRSSAASKPTPRRLPVLGVVGVEGGLHTALGPETWVNWSAVVGVQSRRRWGVRLVGTWAPGITTRKETEQAELEAGGGRVEVGWALYRSAQAGFVAQLFTEVFAIHARGLEGGRLTRSDDDWVAWVGAGPELRAYVGDRWRFEGFIALPSGVVRHEIWMDLPDGRKTYFKAPSPALRAGIGVTTLLGEK